MVYRAGLQLDQLSEDKNLVVPREIFFHERKVPPSAVQPRRAVVQDNFEDGLCSVTKPFEAHSDNSATGSPLPSFLKFGDFFKMRRVVVWAGAVQQEIFNCMDPQASQ